MGSSERRRWTWRRVAALVAGALCGVFTSTPAALAEPVENPCSLGVTVLCHFMPIAPEWEGDIDLTRTAPTDAGAVLPEERTPADYCVNGCI